MDPIVTAAVNAICVAALASAKEVASAAVKDAYSALKRVITDRYPASTKPLEALEKDPEELSTQDEVARQLSATGAANDADVRKAISQLRASIDELRREPTAAALFEFDSLIAERRFELSDVETTPGTPVLVVKGAVRFGGDTKLTNIKQRGRAIPEKN